jgi:serine protease Do
MFQEQSLGSGVIVSVDGYILSNNHVVEGADEVKVSLGEGRADLIAKVVGTDPPTDISVLKVDAKDLSPITITDSSNLEVGDTVMAVGNPFGVGQTVTAGIVSAVGRGGFGIVDYEDFIQTDASINPGNSGGPLVDVEGRLVGVNTAIISGTGGNMGIGFAVPANMVRSVMDRIIKDGRVIRGFLGVQIQPLDPELAQEFHLPSQSGALVGDVRPRTPAERAGIEAGDVITEFDGKKVNDSRHLRLMVSQTAPGTKTKLKLLRPDKNNKIVEMPITVTLSELPAEALAMGRGGRNNRDVTPAQTEVLDGLGVTDIDNKARTQFKIPEEIHGALVTEVSPDSAAFEAGLRPGDVIQEVNRQRVRDADTAIEASKKLKGNKVLLRVWSRGGSRYVVVESAEKK